MSRKMGFWAVFALVTGSQIGSGILMLPVSLAPFGAYSLVGWLLSGLGAVMLAMVFANLCSRFPRTGGPHAYVQETFGNTAAFFTGWTYWLISWVSTPIVLVATIGYLSAVIGPHSAMTNLGLEIGLLALLTAINFRGVKTAGSAEFVLTLLKIIPLLIVPLAALSLFEAQNFQVLPEANEHPTPISMVFHVTLLTLWGFIGLESATTPAGSVENPTKTIPRAVVLGTLCVAILYFLNSIGIMGAIPAQDLAHSTAPYADVTKALFAGNWHVIVSFIAAIVCIGTLNAWILASGQIALGVAQDKLFPAFFAKTNRHGAPSHALLVSSTGIIPILVLTMNGDLAQQINAIIDFSVAAFLFVYAICALAYLKLLWQERKQSSAGSWFFATGALVFCGAVIAATPVRTLLFASLFVVSGVPIFIYMRNARPCPT